MTISREVTVWCDHPECGNWEQSSSTAADLRRRLRKHGWKVGIRGGRDYCRECVQEHGL
ncbi:hypothetical protein SEA_SUCHA_29 [Microbacterium phage Sucha]|nr:hypothetical protein SEA_SUCHA_29 [Microbacterium phage Sucha]